MYIIDYLVDHHDNNICIILYYTTIDLMSMDITCKQGFESPFLASDILIII